MATNLIDTVKDSLTPDVMQKISSISVKVRPQHKKE